MDLVAGAVGNLAPKLLQLLQDEYKLPMGVKAQVESLVPEIKSMHATLCTVAKVPYDHLDVLVRLWASEVSDALYDMQNVLDTFFVRVDAGNPTSDADKAIANCLHEKMDNLFGLSKIKARRDIAGAIEDIEKQVDEVAKRGDRTMADTLPTNIPASFLREITNNLSDERKFSESPFGTVYKGILPDWSLIAVKKLHENSQVPPETKFANELSNLMAIQHENIVKLLGYCNEIQREVVKRDGRYIVVDVNERFLCYEYLPRGSLDEYLHRGSLDKYHFQSHGIDWDTRFNIIKGICKGLHFLHTGMDTPVAHMYLKAENILLDDNMAPKISDFGLSRIFGPEQTRIYTLNDVGALGYLAPEYVYRGEISTHSDIYSLGVLIIEISTGDKITHNKYNRFGIEIIEEVRQKLKRPIIMSPYRSFDASRLHEVELCIEIGLECVILERTKRPSIVDIIDRLNGKR